MQVFSMINQSSRHKTIVLGVRSESEKFRGDPGRERGRERKREVKGKIERGEGKEKEER